MEIIYKVELTKQAIKDIHKLKAIGLYKKAEKIRNILRENPYDFISKKLSGDLSGKRSIRINLQHRLVYEALLQIFAEYIRFRVIDNFERMGYGNIQRASF